MAEDARISTALPTHPKTRKLRKRIGVEGCWALVCLILWVANNRCDGSLSGLTDEDIELAADWQGEANAFVHALVEVGFLDGTPGYRAMHDWLDHNPWVANRGQRIEAARKAARTRWGNAENAEEECVPHAHRMLAGCEPDAQRMHTARKGNAHHPTQPNPTKTNTSCAATSAAPASVIALPLNDSQEFAITGEQIAEWQALYPAVDVEQELRKMRGWALANPRNRKTKNGVLRFVNRWLSKAQDEAPVSKLTERTPTTTAVDRERAKVCEAAFIADADRSADGQGQAAWGTCLEFLRKHVNPHSFDTWIRPLRYLCTKTGVLYVKVPTPEFTHVGEKYSDLLGEAVSGLQGIDGVQFVCLEQVQ